MVGIYVHIPYCRKACTYCNFHFSTNLKSKDELIQSIIKQIKTDDFIKENKISTVYFGGGTPSLLSKEELTMMMEEIYKRFDLASDAPEAHKFVQLARERYDIYHEYRKTGAREVYISDADRQRIFVIEKAMRQILSRIF